MFRVSILLYEIEDLDSALEAEVPAYLERAGIQSEFASRTLRDLDMDPEKVAAFVTKNPSDAWVVCAGSKAVLEWFAKQPFPTIGLFGYLSKNTAGVGPTHMKPLEKCIHRFIELGHKNFVMFTREDRRKPKLGTAELRVLNLLENHNLSSECLLLPDWEESLSGFRACLDSLFAETPPHAIVLQEAYFAMPTLQFLKERGINTPGQVSLFCSDYSPNFEWCTPQIAHSRWDHEKVIQRIVEWANNVSRGNEDKVHTIIDAEYVEGGTIGPPPPDEWNKRTEGKVW